MKKAFTLFALLAVAFQTACGGSGSGLTVASISSLDQIPDTSEVVNVSGSASAAYYKGRRGFNLTSCTAPKFSELTTDHFWGTTLDDAENLGSLGETEAQAVINDFWDGMSRCYTIQNNGQAMEEIGQSGTSLCYMKNAPNAESGVTITSGDVSDPSALFQQAESTRLVRIDATNMGDGPGEEEEESGDQNIFIKVYGTNTTEGSAGYAVDLWFCNENESTPNGYEQIRVTASDGTISMENAHTRGSSDQGSTTVSAKLCQDRNNNIVFCPNQNRQVDAQYKYTWDGGQGSESGYENVRVVVDANGRLTNLRKGSHTRSNETEVYNDYAITDVCGTSFADLKIEQGAFCREWERSGQPAEGFNSAFAYSSTAYANDDDSDIAASIPCGNGAAGLSSIDYFGSAASEVSVSVSSDDYPCDATPDVTVSMDGSDAGFQAVQTLCEAHRLDFGDTCWDEDVRAAEQAIFSYHSR